MRAFALTDQRIPEVIRPALQEYTSLVNRQLPGLMEACYLEGSIALGGFNERFSDIDFIAVLRHPATLSEMEDLGLIHRTIAERLPQWAMMGSYLPSDTLMHSGGGGELCLEVHHTRLKPDKWFDVDSVEGWILKHHGITLMGPDPRGLPFTVSWAVVIQWMRKNLHSYWGSYTQSPKRMLTLVSDWGIQWTVLGVLRQFYSFREHSITTKTEAGEYALTCLPVRWHRLIQEAICIRECRTGSAYRSRIARAMDAICFVRYIIQTCDASFA